jgi:ribosomal protein S2
MSAVLDVTSNQGRIVHMATKKAAKKATKKAAKKTSKKK